MYDKTWGRSEDIGIGRLFSQPASLFTTVWECFPSDKAEAFVFHLIQSDWSRRATPKSKPPSTKKTSLLKKGHEARLPHL